VRATRRSPLRRPCACFVEINAANDGFADRRGGLELLSAMPSIARLPRAVREIRPRGDGGSRCTNWQRYWEASAPRARGKKISRLDALRFWAIALAGLVAAPLIGLGMRALLDRRQIVEASIASSKLIQSSPAHSSWTLPKLRRRSASCSVPATIGVDRSTRGGFFRAISMRRAGKIPPGATPSLQPR
jgi:hypothetical protein